MGSDHAPAANVQVVMDNHWDEIISMESTELDSGEYSAGYDETDDDSDSDEEVSILCEIVGARHLCFPDGGNGGDLSSDLFRPYCIVKFGDRVIHQTNRAADTGCDPIWTMSTKGLFLLKANPNKLSRSMLNIALYTKQDKSLSVRFLHLSSLFLGQVNLEPTTILENCNNDRFEVNIEDEMGNRKSKLGTLALRFRIATQSDRKIMNIFSRESDWSKQTTKELASAMLDSSQDDLFRKSTARPLATLVTETAETEIARTSFVNAMNYVFSSRKIHDKETGRDKFRIKPYPDPSRIEETKFMSKEEIHVETEQPSHSWIEAGSGGLGKLYVEILSCDDLPNVDVGEAVGNVTDSFVALVYEDTCAMTEVIDDELSPHWLPWTQRAFCFGMMHPASILYLGVFDYDLGIGNHEALGRIAVNVANLQRNTVYTLKYNLYPSSNITDRTANGTITIRLRIECFDEKAALLAALKPRPRIHVNVKREKSFKVIRYTCFGEYDNEETFDLTVTKSYINEIFEYKAALGYAISDTLRSLMFWRGQVEICTILVPLHSFLFFCMATNLVERPHMIVPYSLLGVAWVMVATNTIRCQHPSPWHRSPSFWNYLELLRTGKTSTPVESIKEFEGHEAALAYEDTWQQRLEQDRLLAEKRAALQLQINTIGDDNISTKVSNQAIPLELLGRLTRYQGIIGRFCEKCRFVKVIISWEESIVSFWFTAVFLAAGLVALLLPWNFILLWAGRIIVWGFFGPHMKLVDLYLSDNKHKDDALHQLKKNFDVQSKMARLRREEAVKQKDIKALAFGKYSVQVPSFNLARHYDRPLPGSFARICRQASIKNERTERRLSVANLSREAPWIPGQQLFGTMIPRPEHEAIVFQSEAQNLDKQLSILRHRVDEIRKVEGVESPLKVVKGAVEPPSCKRASTSRKRVSFGYEVIPHFDFETTIDEIPGDDSTTQKRNSRTRLSVVLSSDEDEFAEIADGSNEVILENDGVSIYEINKDEDPFQDEEGLEVVGLGRYSTVIDMSDDVHDELMAVDSEESIMEDRFSRLSLQYPSSPKVNVAFYRPLNASEIQEAHLKKD